MKHHMFEETAARSWSVIAAVIFISIAGVSTRAQFPTQPADTTNPDRIRQQEQSRRELQLRAGPNGPETTTDSRRVKEIGSEIELDFQKILTMHNQLARFLLDKKPLDYDFVSEATAEIKKHATHLQKTLALTTTDDEQGKDKYPEFAEARMREGVAMLCKQIKSFVTNPVIENPGTVNATQLANARRDLQDVIDLSTSLKKSSEKLKKPNP